MDIKMANISKVIIVDGMSCNHCVNAVTEALSELDGVNGVQVNLTEKEVSVQFDSEKINDQKLFETIEEIGYDAIH